jgi:hypothetical protein
MIEVLAAMSGAAVTLAGMGAFGFSRKSDESREAVIRLTAAVESIAVRLSELHEDMKTDRREVYTRLNEHGNRITLLEGRDR